MFGRNEKKKDKESLRSTMDIYNIPSINIFIIYNKRIGEKKGVHKNTGTHIYTDGSVVFFFFFMIMIWCYSYSLLKHKIKGDKKQEKGRLEGNSKVKTSRKMSYGN